MAVELSLRYPLTLSGFGRVHAIAGRTDHASAVLEELRKRSRTEYVSPYHVAVAPGARVVLLPCGHEVPFEMPTETAGLVEAYLASLRS
jgi:hypothetical protein